MFCTCNHSPGICSSQTLDGNNTLLLIDFIHFLANLIVAGFVLRFMQIKLAGSDMGKALSFVY